jgi:hypothetical protein
MSENQSDLNENSSKSNSLDLNQKESSAFASENVSENYQTNSELEVLPEKDLISNENENSVRESNEVVQNFENVPDKMSSKPSLNPSNTSNQNPITESVLQEESEYSVDGNDEDDFPEYANDYNKEIHRKILQKKKETKEILEKIEEVKESFQVMEEHYKNIKVEIKYSENLNDAKQSEIESEKHFALLLNRQIGKMNHENNGWDLKVAELREKLNDSQQKIFENNQKMEKIRLEINWNQEEMDQWLLAARQKEEDGMAIERYQRADESKIKELNLNIEKLTSNKSRLESELDKEITETQALQIQLNKMSEEFQKESINRHRLFEHWDGIIKHIALKNQIQIESTSKIQEIQKSNAKCSMVIEQKQKHFKKEESETAQKQEEISKIERKLFQKKSKIKGLKETEHDSKASLKILQNRLSAFSSELEKKKKFLVTLNNDLTLKQKRLSLVENSFHKENKLFLNGLATEKELEKMTLGSENKLKKQEKDFNEFLKIMGTKKHEFYQVQKELFRLKHSQSTLVAETAGLVTKIKNMAAHSNRLYADIQKQQELLYNAEYQIQLLERKVARAQGEKTIEETDFLIEKIREAKEEKVKVSQKYQSTVIAMKQLGDEHRALDKKIKTLEEEEKKYTVLIEKINLENDMTLAELSSIVAKKEDVLVQNNIMKLEIQKLQDKVILNHNNILDLENRKSQLELSMSQREKEVNIHQAVLQTELKLAEQERHKTAVELADRKNKVKNLQIKYQSLIQSKQGNVDVFEHSQAYYIIKAAQEREELERMDDEIKAKIAKSEFEYKALINTLEHLKNRNVKFRELQLNKNATEGDFELRKNLQNQFQAIGNQLVEKKNEFEGLKTIHESNQHYFKELVSRYEILKNSKKEKQTLVSNLRVEEQEQIEKTGRAKKAVAKNKTILETKKFKIDSFCHELTSFYQIILESSNKTINSIILLVNQSF